MGASTKTGIIIIIIIIVINLVYETQRGVLTVAFAVWGKESITKTIYVYKLLLNALNLLHQ
jgi:hypothetical protein